MRRLATKTLSERKRKELLRLYKRNEWYITRIAQYISSLSSASIEDLKQEGFLGFVRAFELYDPKRASFLTYAQHWIKMAMFSYAYRTSYLIEVPEDFHLIFSRYQKIRQANGGRIAIDRAAEELKVTVSKLKKVIISIRGLKATGTMATLERVKHYEDRIDMAEDTMDKSGILPLAKRSLTDEEFFVLDHLLALTCDTPKTLGWVGNIIGVTKERVRQIKNTALEKLKAAFSEESDGV